MGDPCVGTLIWYGALPPSGLLGPGGGTGCRAQDLPGEPGPVLGWNRSHGVFLPPEGALG